MEFNYYPALEEAYGEKAFEMHKRDMNLIDKIIESYIKLVKKFGKHGKRI